MRPGAVALKSVVNCNVFCFTVFFTDSSLQASQLGTKTQGVTKEEEKRRIEAKESDTSTTRPRYEMNSMNDFTHHTAEAAVVLLGGRSLPQTDIVEAQRKRLKE